MHLFIFHKSNVIFRYYQQWVCLWLFCDIPNISDCLDNIRLGLHCDASWFYYKRYEVERCPQTGTKARISV